MSLKPCLVQTTTEQLANAQLLAENLLALRLAACVQLEPIRSLYHWKGENVSAEEIRLTIKTAEELLLVVEEAIKKDHVYDCPEIIALPILQITEDYQQWLEDYLYLPDT